MTVSYFALANCFVVRREAVVLLKSSSSGFGQRANWIVRPPCSFRQIGVETEPVPEILGDERQERMKQPQRVRENEVDHGERVGFARLRRSLESERGLVASRYQSQNSLQKKR